LDEVSDLSAVGQAKLLRALQEQEIRRVGSNEGVKIDLRVLSASCRNLQDLVSAGRFREDLLYRINTVTIVIPPLRERTDDIALLAELFLSRHGVHKQVPVTDINNDAMQVLKRFPWPGNVRQLEHVIERAVALSTHAILSIDDLPVEMLDEAVDGSQNQRQSFETLGALQREKVLTVYEATGRNKDEASRQLGISRRTLYRLLNRYGFNADRARNDQ
jgi:transcriptional regulator with PAS, ATPase and Fis domain